MKLDRVTITGADDSIHPSALTSLSREFPFVEWGILFSTSQVGGPRFPSLEWVRGLPLGLKYSAHLCGRYVRDLVLEARFTWWEQQHEIPVRRFDRIQLNFHGQFHRQHRNFLGEATLMSEAQFILQCDGVNDDAARDLCRQEPERFVPLFDTSGGAGRSPSSWPEIWPNQYCGYAGGLGPENVVEQLQIIEMKANGRRFWIDMERRVRTPDDRGFDLGKVYDVLQQVQHLVTV